MAWAQVIFLTRIPCTLDMEVKLAFWVLVTSKGRKGLKRWLTFQWVLAISVDPESETILIFSHFLYTINSTGQ